MDCCWTVNDWTFDYREATQWNILGNFIKRRLQKNAKKFQTLYELSKAPDPSLFHPNFSTFFATYWPKKWTSFTIFKSLSMQGYPFSQPALMNQKTLQGIHLRKLFYKLVQETHPRILPII